MFCRLRIIVLVVTLVVLIPINITDASNLPKPNSKCKKEGLSQKKNGNDYICVKKGKKLIWSRGVTISKAQTLPGANSNNSPTSKVETWQSTRNRVISNYLERVKTGRDFDFEFILSPTVNKEKANETINAYKEASRNWTWLFDSSKTYSIIWVLLTEKDYDWWYAKVLELQGQNAVFPWDKSKNEFGHCILSQTAFCGYGSTQKAPDGNLKFFQYNVIGSDFKEKPVANTVHHESVHFYQLANNMSYPNDLPCWYIEGQATYYGNVLSGLGEVNFQKSRIVNTLPGSDKWNSEKWLQTLALFQTNQEECRRDSRNYFIGSFLWEYLLMNYSEQIIHQVHLALKEQTWSEVVPIFFGKSVDQLNQDLSHHMVSFFSRK